MGAIQPGLDGDQLFAVDDGWALYVERNIPYYGDRLTIKLDNGLIAEYSHCKDIVVVEGSKVNMGQVVAHMGNTDGGTRTSTATHVHFVLKRLGVKINPEPYLTISYDEFMSLKDDFQVMQHKFVEVEDKILGLQGEITLLKANKVSAFKARKIAKRKANDKITKRVKKKALKSNK